MIEIVLLEDSSHVVKHSKYSILNELRAAEDEAYEVALLNCNIDWIVKEGSEIIHDKVFVGKGSDSSIINNGVSC